MRVAVKARSTLTAALVYPAFLLAALLGTAAYLLLGVVPNFIPFFAGFGQELPPARMEALISSAGRTPRQRSTTYGEPSPEQVPRSFEAADLRPVVQTPAPGWARNRGREALVRPGLEVGGVHREANR
jgi:hypothetical protein